MIPEYDYLDLVFENCNWLRIPVMYVWGMSLGEITESLWINQSGQWGTMKIAKRGILILNDEVLKLKTRWEQDTENLKNDSAEDHLLHYQNITSIHLISNGEEVAHICVPWDSANQYDTRNLLELVSIDGENNRISIHWNWEE